MPKDSFYDLGRDPKKVNDMDKPEKKSYPGLYDVNVDNFPPLKDMKLGDTGEALIQFRIKGGSGIEVMKMKYVSSAASKEEPAKDNPGTKKDKAGKGEY